MNEEYKNYSHLQAFYSPYPLPPGGAGVTSGKNQFLGDHWSYPGL